MECKGENKAHSSVTEKYILKIKSGREGGREGGGRGIGMGNTCKSMADSCQCTTKPLQYCKEISLQLIKINRKKRCISKNNIKKERRRYFK